MESKEVVKHWEGTFEKIGYRETKPNNWVKEKGELIVVLRVLTLAGDYQFYVDVGLIIKKLYDYRALKRPVFRYHHFGQSLWLLLYYLQEKERYLNKLFCFNPVTNTDPKIIANISELAMLYRTKVAPFLDTLDHLLSIGNDAEDSTAWEQLYKYFHPSLNMDQCYW
jgi:hypothetical protein